MEDVGHRLEAAFTKMESSTVQGCIDKSNGELKKLAEFIRHQDEEGQSEGEQDDEETAKDVASDMIDHSDDESGSASDESEYD